MKLCRGESGACHDGALEPITSLIELSPRKERRHERRAAGTDEERQEQTESGRNKRRVAGTNGEWQEPRVEIAALQRQAQGLFARREDQRRLRSLVLSEKKR